MGRRSSSANIRVMSNGKTSSGHETLRICLLNTENSTLIASVGSPFAYKIIDRRSVVRGYERSAAATRRDDNNVLSRKAEVRLLPVVGLRSDGPETIRSAAPRKRPGQELTG